MENIWTTCCGGNLPAPGFLRYLGKWQITGPYLLQKESTPPALWWPSQPNDSELCSTDQSFVPPARGRDSVVSRLHCFASLPTQQPVCLQMMKRCSAFGKAYSYISIRLSQCRPQALLWTKNKKSFYSPSAFLDHSGPTSQFYPCHKGRGRLLNQVGILIKNTGSRW